MGRYPHDPRDERPLRAKTDERMDRGLIGENAPGNELTEANFERVVSAGTPLKPLTEDLIKHGAFHAQHVDSEQKAEPASNPLIDLGELYQREADQRREHRDIARRVFAEAETEVPFLDTHLAAIEAIQRYCNDIAKLTLTGISPEGAETWKQALIQTRRDLIAQLDGTFDWAASRAAHTRFSVSKKEKQ